MRENQCWEEEANHKPEIRSSPGFPAAVQQFRYLEALVSLMHGERGRVIRIVRHMRLDRKTLKLVSGLMLPTAILRQVRR